MTYVETTRLANSKFKPSPAVLSVATMTLIEALERKAVVAFCRAVVDMSPCMEVSKSRQELLRTILLTVK